MSVDEIPILFIVFNRPDTTARVWETLRTLRPKRLFVAADGPRNAREAENCEQTRAIVRSPDWDCDLKKLFREYNAGLKRAVVEALDWFFDNVEEGVVLEDDCLAHPDFFRFCAAMLERFRDDDRVYHIGGNNWQRGRRVGTWSAYFSLYPHIWGWATWRRAWKLMDAEMRLWPSFRDAGMMRELFPHPTVARWWQNRLERVWRGEFPGAWSYQWTFAGWVNGKLSLTPNVNLVSNIGFGRQGTHTLGSRRHHLAAAPVAPLPAPYTAPPFFVPCRSADLRAFRYVFKPNYGIKLLNKIHQWVD
ncbi:MAG: glycosyltransferase family 2 protein [Bacteroidia bacterium]|nr:glycosyltransferase family 2 protein [Bacteroidia bacterium]MDW8333673.1 glycosyltransferase family 2 protein [Bacteroidia bacterium]